MIAATLTFNFYFFEPIGTFTIDDPRNWVALFSFLVTSLIASRLSTEAKWRALDAIARRQDLERLYTFSRAILLTIAFLGTLGLVAQASKSEPVLIRESFDTFPMEIDGWRGRQEAPFTADVLAVLGVDAVPYRYGRIGFSAVRGL